MTNTTPIKGEWVSKAPAGTTHIYRSGEESTQDDNGVTMTETFNNNLPEWLTHIGKFTVGSIVISAQTNWDCGGSELYGGEIGVCKGLTFNNGVRVLVQWADEDGSYYPTKPEDLIPLTNSQQV